MLLSRLRTFRMVATWWVRQTSPPFPSASMKSKIARKTPPGRRSSGPEGPVAQLAPVLAADHPLRQEIDEGVRLGVHVVPVEHHLGVLEHLAQAPDQRLGVRGSASLVRSVLRFTPSGRSGA